MRHRAALLTDTIVPRRTRGRILEFPGPRPECLAASLPGASS